MTPSEWALADRLRDHLTDDLRRPPWKGDPNPVAGHCYVLTESIYHALGGVDLRTMTRRHEGSPHWWIVDERTGEVVDLTRSQFRTPVPYLYGHPVPLLPVSGGGPSARALRLLIRSLGVDWSDHARVPRPGLWVVP